MKSRFAASKTILEHGVEIVPHKISHILIGWTVSEFWDVGTCVHSPTTRFRPCSSHYTPVKKPRSQVLHTISSTTSLSFGLTLFNVNSSFLSSYITCDICNSITNFIPRGIFFSYVDISNRSQSGSQLVLGINIILNAHTLQSVITSQLRFFVRLTSFIEVNLGCNCIIHPIHSRFWRYSVITSSEKAFLKNNSNFLGAIKEIRNDALGNFDLNFIRITFILVIWSFFRRLLNFHFEIVFIADTILIVNRDLFEDMIYYFLLFFFRSLRIFTFIVLQKVIPSKTCIWIVWFNC